MADMDSLEQAAFAGLAMVDGSVNNAEIDVEVVVPEDALRIPYCCTGC